MSKSSQSQPGQVRTTALPTRVLSNEKRLLLFEATEFWVVCYTAKAN